MKSNIVGGSAQRSLSNGLNGSFQESTGYSGKFTQEFGGIGDNGENDFQALSIASVGLMKHDSLSIVAGNSAIGLNGSGSTSSLDQNSGLFSSNLGAVGMGSARGNSIGGLGSPIDNSMQQGLLANLTTSTSTPIAPINSKEAKFGLLGLLEVIKATDKVR